MSEMEWATPPQQPEAVAWPKVLGAIALTLSLFAASVAVVYFAGRSEARSREPHGPMLPLAVGEREIGMVFQVPFPVEVRGYRRRAEQLQWLREWGWVDRAHGLVHEPVERAMEELLAEDARSRGVSP